MTTRPTPIVHQSIEAPRAFYAMRRRGMSAQDAHLRCKWLASILCLGAL